METLGVWIGTAKKGGQFYSQVIAILPLNFSYRRYKS